MTAVLTIAGYGLREALRRKVFVVVCLLTVAFVILYWIGNRYTFRHVADIVPPAGIDAQAFAGAFLFGMAMFGTLFLGTVLAIFLTLGVVRGDAERGLLQPLVVRPLGRSCLVGHQRCVALVVGIQLLVGDPDPVEAAERLVALLRDLVVGIGARRVEDV